VEEFFFIIVFQDCINEIGYYQEVKSYKGITGRYIDFSGGSHFEVEQELSIE
jgi:hypothetical protein